MFSVHKGVHEVLGNPNRKFDFQENKQSVEDYGQRGPPKNVTTLLLLTPQLTSLEL